MRKLRKRIFHFFLRLARKNFALTHWLKYRRYCRIHNASKIPLVIFQMGKVGSSTVVNSIKQHSPEAEVFQVHVLTQNWIKKVYSQYRKSSKIHGHVILDEHLLASELVRKMLDEKPQQFRWKVVTLVREPIARNISAFFEAFPIYFPREAARFNRQGVPYNERISEMSELFLNKFDRHLVPLEWFDEHMNPVFGIDVFNEKPFSPEKGFNIYHGANVDLLLLRLEDLDRCASFAFKEFLDIDNFELQNTNLSREKSYASAYAEFNKTIHLPATYIDEMYDSKFVKHFYSDAERSQFREKWLKRTGNSRSQFLPLLKSG